MREETDESSVTENVSSGQVSCFFQDRKLSEPISALSLPSPETIALTHTHTHTHTSVCLRSEGSDLEYVLLTC